MLHLLMNKTQKLLFLYHRGRKINLDSSSSQDENLQKFNKDSIFKKTDNIEQKISELLFNYDIKSSFDRRLLQSIFPKK